MNKNETIALLESKQESVSMSFRDWFRVITLIGKSDEEDASKYIDKIQSELSLSIMEYLRIELMKPTKTKKEDEEDEEDEDELVPEFIPEFQEGDKVTFLLDSKGPTSGTIVSVDTKKEMYTIQPDNKKLKLVKLFFEDASLKKKDKIRDAVFAKGEHVLFEHNGYMVDGEIVVVDEDRCKYTVLLLRDKKRVEYSFIQAHQKFATKKFTKKK